MLSGRVKCIICVYVYNCSGSYVVRRKDTLRND